MSTRTGHRITYCAYEQKVYLTLEKRLSCIIINKVVYLLSKQADFEIGQLSNSTAKDGMNKYRKKLIHFTLIISIKIPITFSEMGFFHSRGIISSL